MKRILFGRCKTAPFWLFHILLVFTCLIVCVVKPRQVSTDFMDIIPDKINNAGILKANEKFTASQNLSVSMFVRAKDFSTAAEYAGKFCDRLMETDLFDSLDYRSSAVDIDILKNFITDNAYLFLDEKTQDEISDDVEEFQQDSLAGIYSAFTFSSLDVLGKDPFLVSEKIWLPLLDKVSSLSGVSEKDGVIACEHDGCWYVMLTGTLRKETMNVAKTKGGVGTVFEIGDGLEKENDCIEIFYSGVPFHTYESASSSQKEITVISLVSVFAVLCLFLAVFRNLKILKFFLLSLVVSLVSAVCGLLIFFRQFHIMTLIFGTSLIGTCIDYSIHFYVAFGNRGADEDGFAVKRKLFKSLTISFCSTFLCYMLLLCSSYSILRQIAVFSGTGLLSSYIVALFLYPSLIPDGCVKKSEVKVVNYRQKKSLLLPCIALFTTVLLAVQFSSARVKNNITDLYTPSERLMKGESLFSELMGYSDTSYAILAGRDFYDVLEKEDRFVNKISDCAESVAVCSFIPTEDMQLKSIECAKRLLSVLDTQAEFLGLTDEETKAFAEKVETLQPMEEVPSMLNVFSLGEIDGNWYEAVIIRNVSDVDSVKQAAEETGVFYFRTAEDVSASLDVLTWRILILFAVGFVLITVSLVCIFGFKQGFTMALAPYSIICGTLGLSLLFGLSPDFFFAVGLVLIVGLGLDYIVFASTGGSVLSVTLSFITTEFSFGTLVFSSFKPVHIFGLTVFIGIMIAYICAMCSDRGR